VKEEVKRIAKSHTNNKWPHSAGGQRRTYLWPRLVPWKRFSGKLSLCIWV